MKKAIIQCLREHIINFPELKDGCLMVDYLGDKPIEYTVEPVPCDPVHTRYTDGSCIKQFLFIFASREYYGADINRNIENLGFYEEFADWITETELPDLDGRIPVSIEVVTGGYAFDTEANTARYQIQLRLLYEEE